MEEKKNTRQQLEDEELTDVSGGYYSATGLVVPNLENTVSSGSYATARASVGVHVAAVNEAVGIPQPASIDVSAKVAQRVPSGEVSISKWKGDDM